MKMKTLSATCVAPVALPRPSEAAAPKIDEPRRTAFEAVRTATVDPFPSLVRKLIDSAPLPSPDATPASVNGTIVAETKVDGVRYALVRCAPKPNEALLSLSPRERDIVNLITKGYPNKMIAELLDISAWTVGTHLRRIFAKLGVTSRAAMVARYLHHTGDSPQPHAAVVVKEPLRLPLERA
jgi:DNA-binding CsgD family transcriptional regulator